MHEKEVKQPKPEYSQTELDRLVFFVQKMVFLDGIKNTDWNAECDDVIKKWFLETNHIMLTIYFDPNHRLTANLSYPEVPILEIVYFLRKPNHIFDIENFHDDITFGQIGDDVDGTLLLLVEKIYAPYFFQKTDWSETNRNEFLSSIHSFLANMTALHYKLSGLTVLYVPSEGIDIDIEQSAGDTEYIQRMEMIAEEWIVQLRICLNDFEQVTPYDLLCPVNEYDFWIYRCE